MNNPMPGIPEQKETGEPIPVYFRLQTMLRKEIENRRWTPGQKIPTERMIAENYAVSIGTVKKAILNLVNQGFLYRIQGKGTFVAGMSLNPESLRYYRFRDSFPGHEGELQIKLLNLKVVKSARPAVYEYLQIKANQKLYEIKRLFMKNDQPVVFSISYMPWAMYRGLENLPRHHFENLPLYIELERRYGLPTLHNQELFSAATADARTAKQLEIHRGTPVLFIEMLSFTYKQRPYEYRKSYCQTGRKAIYREI